MRKILYAVLAASAGSAPLLADEAAPRYALSVYSSAAVNGDALFSGVPDNAAPGGYAVVRDRRTFDLKAGSAIVEVRDASRYLDPSALSVRALDETAAEIASQRFDDETVSLDALVQTHIGRSVEIVTSGTPPAVISGTLLSNAGGLTLQGADGRVMTITEFSRITFADLPKNLSPTPTLRLEIAARKTGPQVFEIVYPTQGLAWRAEYSGWLANGECRIALSGWAQIANRSGTDFADAKIKLIAGEPHHAAAAPAPRMMARAAPVAMAAEDSGNAGDYHEYTIERPVALASGTLLRAALFPAQTLPCQRQYLFEGSRLRANPGMAPITERNFGNDAAGPIRSTLSLRSERALPAGRLRILQNAADGTPEFIGEDDIAHTPKGEAIAVQLGNAFDLRGERKQTEFNVDKDHRTLSETFAVRVSNGGATAQAVVVREHLYRWSQWSIAQSSVKYAKRDADTIDFTLDVPANGNASLNYTVQYQWSESFK